MKSPAPPPAPSAPVVTRLALRPVPCLVAPDVFDAYHWHRPRELEWWRPQASLRDDGFDAELPVRMAFVFRDGASREGLPAELARLHVGKAYGFTDAQWCLAPYGIDDATDVLFERSQPAPETFFLATDNLNALYWGLHDWAHFHSHGPFDDVPSTEWQCDLSALCWLYENRAQVPSLTEERFEALRFDVLRTHRSRCEKTGRSLPDGLLASPEGLRAFALHRRETLPCSATVPAHS